MKLKSIPVYILLLAIFPATQLWTSNYDQVDASDVLRPVFTSVILALATFLVTYLIYRDLNKAALLSAGMLVLFFSYGQVYALFRYDPGWLVNLARHRILIPLWLALAAAWIWIVSKKVDDASRFTFGLNMITGGLILFQMLQIGYYEYRAWDAERSFQGFGSSDQANIEDELTTVSFPDIYYIILDTYTREDILADIFEYDNTEFIHELEDQGFYVARCSQSNYARTELSLSSSLNFNYIDQLIDEIKVDSTDKSSLRPLIRQSETRTLLESLGYKIVAFESGFGYTRIKDADIYLSPPLGSLEEIGGAAGLSSFEVLFLESTAGLILTDAAQFLPKSFVPDVEYEERLHRARILYTLDELEKMPQTEGPKFVFAHLLVPHRPFVFGPEGEVIDAENAPGLGAPINDNQSMNDYIHGYRDQLTYVNTRIHTLVERLISDSENQPVIILQGDHGIEKARTEEERMVIFNAYFIPGGSYDSLNQEITPVNTFRVVFNELFDTQYPLLDDVSYYSEWYQPFNFSEVPNECAIVTGG
jgi:hypothetical protein